MLKPIIISASLFLAAPRLFGAGVQIDTMDSLDAWRSKPGGLMLQSEHVREGSGAAAFGLLPGNAVSRTGFETDWTSYEALAFWAYCETPGEGVFGVSLTTLREGETAWNYFRYLIPADWSGWKRFVIGKESFRKVRDPDWAQINLLKFSLEWDGDTRPAPDQTIILDDIRLLSAEEVLAEQPE